MFQTQIANKALGQSEATLKNNTNVPIHGLQPGKSMSVVIDKHGVPIDMQVRRRLKEAEVNNCVSLTTDSQPTAKKGAK